MSIEFPITVDRIEFDRAKSGGGAFNEALLMGGKCGDFVAVRPCDARFEGKTFLGVLIGELALSQHVQFDVKACTLKVGHALHNPMIFIPDCATVVFGCGSWWRRLKDPAELLAITDLDVSNVWYVQALAQLSAG